MIYKCISDKKYEYCSVSMRHYKDGENELNTLGQDGWVAVGILPGDTNRVLMMREFTEVTTNSESEATEIYYERQINS